MLSDWWNGVELWMLGLPFPFQFALVVVVLVPLCLVVAWLIDRIVDHASALFGPAQTVEEPIGSAKHADDASELADSEASAEPPAEESATGEPPAADERVPA
jgi:hypothetical protein